MLKRQYYQFSAENALLKKHGGEFQDFVNDILGFYYGSNFERIKPHGKDGDFKCDGRVPKEGIIFQCYGPERFDESKLIKKIKEDFKGALLKWSDLRKWIFIHNNANGISPRTGQTIDELRKDHLNIEIIIWDKQYLLSIILKLDETFLQRLLGFCPSESDFNKVSIKEVSNMGHLIKGLLETHPEYDNFYDPDPVVPSEYKLSKNNLSECAIKFIELGRHKSSLVNTYLLSLPNPDFAENIAIDFREKYQKLKDEGYNPDQIFYEICIFLGQNNFSSPLESACMYGYMAYFFDRCDIFEDRETI